MGNNLSGIRLLLGAVLILRSGFAAAPCTADDLAGYTPRTSTSYRVNTVDIDHGLPWCSIQQTIGTCKKTKTCKLDSTFVHFYKKGTDDFAIKTRPNEEGDMVIVEVWIKSGQ
jgi:hypothetical protein